MAGFKIEVPNDYFARSAAREYADDAGLALIREFAQNSCDAKAKTVEFTFRAGELIVSDDGKGADAKTIRERVLTPLESFKDGDSVGGFGKAKELLFFANSKWKIRTRDVEVVGSYLDVLEFKTGLEHAPGFLAVVTLPEGLYKSARQHARYFLQSSERPGVSWILDGEQVETEVKRPRKVSKDFGFAKAYVQRDCTDTRIYYRTGGLLTAHRYGYQPAEVGRVVIELVGNSVDLLTPARDNLRLYEHRQAVDAWLNALVTDYRRTLLDDEGDEVLFVDDEFVEPLIGKDPSPEMIPAMESGLEATVGFLRTANAAPTPEQADRVIDALADALGDVLPPSESSASWKEAVPTAEAAPAGAAAPEAPKKSQHFDMALMPKVEGLKRVVVHTGGKDLAKKGAAWIRKHKKQAHIILAAWTTAARTVARMMDVQLDAVGFCFGDLTAEYIRVKNGRWAVMINPTKLDLNDQYAADEVLDCVMHELTHHLRGVQHDEAWVIQEVRVRRKCRPAFVRGTIARSLATGEIESVDEWLESV